MSEEASEKRVLCDIKFSLAFMGLGRGLFCSVGYFGMDRDGMPQVRFWSALSLQRISDKRFL